MVLALYLVIQCMGIRMNNIVLIGMMGSGKSTIAKALKKEIGFDIYDMDFEIEKAQKTTINDIFKKHGESYFRKLENIMCQQMLLNRTVISTGGGIVLNPENIRLLKKMGRVVYLKGSVEVLYKRLMKQTENRPLLDPEQLKKQLEDLLVFRESLYEKSADVIIPIGDLSIDAVTREIIDNLIELGYKFE